MGLARSLAKGFAKLFSFCRELPACLVSGFFLAVLGSGFERRASLMGSCTHCSWYFCMKEERSNNTRAAVRSKIQEFLKRGVEADTMQKTFLLLVEPYITQQNESHDSAGCELLL